MQEIIEELTEVHKLRENFIKSKTAATNRVKALKRTLKKTSIKPENDPTEYYNEILGTNLFEPAEKEYRKKTEELAKKLPFVDWWCSFAGMSYSSYGQLIAETGDLRNYSNPAKVWKRMGLAVYDGLSDKNRTKGVNTGYNKRRRTIAFRISDSIVKQKGHYRDVFVNRKQYETERNDAGGNAGYVRKNRKDLLHTFTSKPNIEKIEGGKLPDAVLNLRAHRYVVKRVIKDTWIKWNDI